jgi:predicted transcriptional regulator
LRIQIQQTKSHIQTGKARYKKEDHVRNAYDDLIQILASDHLNKDNVTKLITAARLNIKTFKSYIKTEF